MENVLGEEAEPFFVNGWGQIAGALEALEDFKDEISDECKQFALKQIAESIAKGSGSANPFKEVNVRGYTKPLLMYPHQGEFFDWQPVKIDEQIQVLNDCLEQCGQLSFECYKGKIYLMINSKEGHNFFQQLWEGDFAQKLKEHGYVAQKNTETPHITLVNSNVIGDLKQAFIKEFGNKGGALLFELFIQDQMQDLNQKLKSRETPFRFSELSSTYSEDYTPFAEVVVARLKSPFITACLKGLAQAAKEKVGFEMPIKDDALYHSAIAIEKRKPRVVGHKNIQERFNALTGDGSVEMVAFLKQFKTGSFIGGEINKFASNVAGEGYSLMYRWLDRPA
jgi:hypothetical protein